MWDAILREALVVGSALGYGAASALVPLLNSEAYLIGIAAVLPRPHWPYALVAFTLGTMVGKAIVFVGAERLAARAGPALRARIDRAAGLLQRWPAATWPIVLVSAIVGLPPFYAVTVAGGILRLSLPAFLVVGMIGRLLRFVGLLYGGSWLFGRA